MALVFLWSGIDMLIEPRHWVASGMPFAVLSVNVIFFLGLFKVLVATSLATGFFIGPFASVAAAFLGIVFLMGGPNEALAQELGLIAGLVSLALWPRRPPAI